MNKFQMIGSPNQNTSIHVDEVGIRVEGDAENAAAKTAISQTKSEAFDKTTQNPPSCVRRTFLASILASLNDEVEDDDDDSITRRNTIYGSDAKETHPFFDDRFIEADGLIVLNPEWEAKQLARREQRQQRLRQRRRIQSW